MATVTREERHRRQANDNGDSDDDVYVSCSRTSASRAYHDDRDCRQLASANGVRPMSRREAQKASRYPCSRCVLEDGGDGGTTGGPSLAQIMAREDVTSYEEATQILADTDRGVEQLGKGALYEAYWAQLKSTQTIADEYDVRKKTIGRWLRSYGIPRRPANWQPGTVVSPFCGFYADDETVPNVDVLESGQATAEGGAD